MSEKLGNSVYLYMCVAWSLMAIYWGYGAYSGGGKETILFGMAVLIATSNFWIFVNQRKHETESANE